MNINTIKKQAEKNLKTVESGVYDFDKVTEFIFKVEPEVFGGDCSVELSEYVTRWYFPDNEEDEISEYDYLRECLQTIISAC
nr:MAG TPA: hypothetical protein [Caudoviricetes sp.]